MNKHLQKFGIGLILIICLILNACSNSEDRPEPLTPTQVEQRYSSGVVLIQTSYCYSISFNNGPTFYFTGISSDGKLENLTMDEEEIKPVTAYGTGFFIGKDGLIATNSHVISPTVDIATARQQIVDAFHSLAAQWSKEINEITENLGVIKMAIIECDSYSDQYELQAAYNELEEERNERQEAVNAIHALGGMNYEATLHSEIGVAYNDSHITNNSDFHPCVTLKEDEEHDLAIIQLKDKTTPENRHIFRIPKGRSRDSEDYESNEENNGTENSMKLYMIGFNLGPTLALTNNGLKAQITSGELSQDTDDAHLMYSIPALHGSSGSPVINQYGKLIAVNFAGLDQAQSFNYGIKISYLSKLLSKVKNKE
ncbi:MAG: serine protease [Muribaculaceae bacterium]|nr:serine protease [Muribaculaceae bacterium]